MASTGSVDSLGSRFTVVLGVERGERTTLSMMVLLAFVLAISFLLFQTSAEGLFVHTFGAHQLPYAYLSVAALASPIAFLYLRLSERIPFVTASFVNLGFLAAMCAVLWLGLESRFDRWFIFFLPFGLHTLVNLANLILWPLAGRLFDVRQAKRLFGLMGAGIWAANILGGFVIGPILSRTGTSSLYLLASLVLMMASPLLWLVFKRHMAAVTPHLPTKTPPARNPNDSKTSPLRNPYSRLIFAYVLLWWVSFCFIDNIFFGRAEIQYPDEALLAGFIGQQLAVIGLIAFITSVFFTRRIVGRFGVRGGLMPMPILTTLSVLLLALAGTFEAPAELLFWTATIAKVFNVSLGLSLSQATGILLYQPLLGHHRHRTETMAEGIIQPLAIGVAGLLLLPFATSMQFSAIRLSYVFLPIAGLWLWVIFRLSGQYPEAVSEALRNRRLGESNTLLFDPAALALMQKTLNNPRPGMALYALSQLEQLDPRAYERNLINALPDLLTHPSPEVRRDALKRILARRMHTAVPLMRSRLMEEKVPVVLSALIEALAAFGDDASKQRIEEALGSPDRLIKSGVISGLLAAADPGQSARGQVILHGLVHSLDVADRELAGVILEAGSYPASTALISKLLSDSILSVRKAAILAASRCEALEVQRELISACDNPRTAPVAERALIAAHAACLPAISEALARKDTQAMPRQRLRSLIRVLGRIRDEYAVELLRSVMNAADPETRLQVLRGLSAHAVRARPSDRVLEKVRAEVESSAWIAGAIQTLEESSRTAHLGALRAALESAFVDARSRVLLLLSLEYDSRSMLRAERMLRGTFDPRFAFAIEVVDVQLPPHLRTLVSPLIENVPYERRLAEWRAGGLLILPADLDTTIETLIGSRSDSKHSAWIRLCAIHAAGMLGIRSCIPLLEDLCVGSDASLSQSSRWSLTRLTPDKVALGEANMLSLVEKVIVLKSASLFGETPDNVLADIAGFAEEVMLEEGQTVFDKGDAGDSLYIIVSGAVKVLDGDRLLNKLGEGEVFGELALLDPEPRVASVRAAETTHLLRLDESSFRVILAERPEVSSAIIRVITRYLRGLLRNSGNVDPNLPDSQSHRAVINTTASGE